MRDDLTAIWVVLDSSGSMQNIRADTIGGFNRFLADQRELPGRAVVTMVTFSNTSRVVYALSDIQEAPPLSLETYEPGGGTALLDALGQTIQQAGNHLSALKESDQPGHVLVCVITDGEENSSREYSFAQVSQMIEHHKQVHGWTFVFVGANLDADKCAQKLQIDAANALQYASNRAGTEALYGAMHVNTARLRSGPSGQAVKGFFAGGDRTAQNQAGAQDMKQTNK